MSKLAVAIMAKNEGKIIERCLSSALAIADKVILMDTGSTDDTIFKSALYLQNAKIPFKIYNEPFIDFADSRSRLLRLCRNDGDIDYVLILDADELVALETDKTLFIKSLNHPLYNITMMSGPTTYHLPRLTSNKEVFQYKGVTHEFMATDHVALPAQHIKIIQVSDSYRRVNNQKTSNDIALLEKGIKETREPKLLARYTFYLAQSYHDEGQLGQAKLNYTRRIALAGWNEEVFYSYYMLGIIAEKLNDHDGVFYNHWMAYETIPTRIESLCALKRYCDSKKLDNISKNALLPILRAAQHPIDGLFLESYLYYAYK